MLPLPALFLLALQEREPFRDPRPPDVHPAPTGAAPEPAATSELTTRAAPKPLPADARSEDWPTFRGPRRDGISAETRLASFGPEGPPLLWELACGPGFSSPAIAGGRLVFTHRQGNEIHVDCLEAEGGRRRWRFSYPTEYEDRYIDNDGPRSTPTIDGERVFVHGLENDLFCLDLAHGSVLWRRDLAEEFGVPLDFFGAVASPLVHGGLLYLNLGVPGGPCVAAFEPATGKLVWGAGTQWGPSCSSPVLGELGGRERLFVLAGGESKPPTGGLLVLDPKTGALDFTYPFRSKIVESVTGASPVLAGERVFVSASYGTGSACLAPRAEGGLRELWTSRSLGLQFSSPVFVGGKLWAIDGKSGRAGELLCLDPESGAELSRTDLSWPERFEHDGKSKEITATVGEGSLLAADGRLLCLGDGGHLLWIDPVPAAPTVLARAWLFRANESWTPPVVVRGLLYLRQTQKEHFGSAPPRLLCYDLRAGA